jgi:hypothetical protein
VDEARTLALTKMLRFKRLLFLDLAARDESMRLMQAYKMGKYEFRLEGDRLTVQIPSRLRYTEQSRDS